MGVVKHKYISTRHYLMKGAGKSSARTSAFKAASSHLHYIAHRPGPEKEIGGREFFDRHDDDLSVKEVGDWLKAETDDRSSFVVHKLILSPPFEPNDPKEYVRHVLEQVGDKMGVDLDWKAVQHDNTDHQHYHLLVSDRDESDRRVQFKREHYACMRQASEDFLGREQPERFRAWKGREQDKEHGRIYRKLYSRKANALREMYQPYEQYKEKIQAYYKQFPEHAENISYRDQRLGPESSGKLLRAAYDSHREAEQQWNDKEQQNPDILSKQDKYKIGLWLRETGEGHYQEFPHHRDPIEFQRKAYGLDTPKERLEEILKQHNQAKREFDEAKEKDPAILKETDKEKLFLWMEHKDREKYSCFNELKAKEAVVNVFSDDRSQSNILSVASARGANKALNPLVQIAQEIMDAILPEPKPLTRAEMESSKRELNELIVAKADRIAKFKDSYKPRHEHQKQLSRLKQRGKSVDDQIRERIIKNQQRRKDLKRARMLGLPDPEKDRGDF